MFHRTTEISSAPIGHQEVGIASLVASTFQDRGIQHALHVTDYLCWKALAHLRAIGACNRSVRKLTDDEFDHNQFSEENGDGSIY